MERKLINYLPYVVRDFDVFKAMMASQQPEFELSWARAEDLMDNQFVISAGNLGLSRWERILEISPKGTDTLDDRRFRILTRIVEELPYTLTRLRAMLEILCGAGNYSATIEDGSYHLSVKIGLVAANSYSDVEALLQRVLPVNIVLDLTQMYNTHGDWSPYTHGQLARWTHNELRSEVINYAESNPSI